MKSSVNGKELFTKALVLSVAATAISAVLCFLMSWLLPVIGVNDYAYLTQYFKWVDTRGFELKKESDPVIIINTQEFTGDSARGQIADLIDALCEADAKVIGVDIRFPSRNDANNDKLLSTLLAHRDRLVLARAIYDDEVRGSFFDKEDSLVFGITNLPSYTDYSPYYSPSGEELFSYKIAKTAFPEKQWDFNRFIVNYEPIHFANWSAATVLESSPESRRSHFEGKIILLGDKDNEKDYHNTPFKIGGSEWAAGVELHAYPLYSLCEDGWAFSSLPWYWDALLSCLLTMIFSLLFTYFALLEPEWKEKNRVLYSIYLISVPFLVLFIDIALMRLCFVTITRLHKLVPNALLFMVSIILISGKLNNFVNNCLTFKSK